MTHPHCSPPDFDDRWKAIAQAATYAEMLAHRLAAVENAVILIQTRGLTGVNGAETLYNHRFASARQALNQIHKHLPDLFVGLPLQSEGAASDD